MSTYDLMKQAIRNKTSVACWYRDRYRILSPHTLGKKKGHYKVLSIQTGGDSSGGLRPTNEENWRCMFLDDILRPVAHDDPWEITVTNWQRYAEGGHRLGPETAAVTIIEFGDYQCPFCRASEPHLKAIRGKYGNDVALVYRHFPLPGHSSAFPAARGAECAGQQDRFWEFHELLYSTESWIGDTSEASLTMLAEQAGVVSVEEFASCLDGTDGDTAVGVDITAGQRLGIAGTPTFLVNHQLHVGPLDSLRFETLFDEIREARR